MTLLVRRPENKDDFITLLPEFDFRKPVPEMPDTVAAYRRAQEYCREIGEQFFKDFPE